MSNNVEDVFINGSQDQKTVVEITPQDSDFQLVVQVLYMSDVIQGNNCGPFRKILLRDETALIYGFIYKDHRFTSNQKILLRPSTFIRITIGSLRGENTVRKCNPDFCANCHPNQAELILRDGDSVELVQPTPTWSPNLYNHIPFKFTELEEIDNLEYGKVVDVIGVVREIHWAGDEDKEGIWDWIAEDKPFRQFGIINIFPHHFEGTTIRCTVWGEQWKKLTTVGAVIAIKGAKVDKGFGAKKGLNIGNTCEIFYINDDDSMWIIPDDMTDFYWKLFGVQSPTSSPKRARITDTTQEIDVELESVIHAPHVQLNGHNGETILNGNGHARSIVDFTSPTNLDPLVVNVVKATEYLVTANRQDVYFMQSHPRGLVLIINNLYFKYRPTEKERKGSFHDERYMSEMFKQMGFKTHIEVNVHFHEFASVIAKFKSRIETENKKNRIDCISVVVMSHGLQNFITLVDEGKINIWTDIVYKFNDQDCPALVGKPKLFIFQACQDFLSYNEHAIRPSQPTQGNHIMKDTLICIPALPGTAACRDIHVGSHYIYCLAKVFMENAAKMDVIEMLQELQHVLTDEAIRHHEDRHQCYWIPLGFRKLLFFNPGLPSVQEDIGSESGGDRNHHLLSF